MRNNIKFLIALFVIIVAIVGCSDKKDIIITTISSRDIAKGIVYREVELQGSVKSNASILEINSNDKNIHLELSTAGKKLDGYLSTVKAMVQANDGIAGINASYYGHGYNAFLPGAIRGLSIINRELVATPNNLDSMLSIGIGITKDNRLKIVHDITYKSEIITENNTKLTNVLVNAFKWEEKVASILFTPRFGYYTPKAKGMKIILTPINEKTLFINREIKARVTGKNSEETVCIPDGSFALLILDNTLIKENDFKVNEIISLKFVFSEAFTDIQNAIASPWYLIENGKTNIKFNKDDNNKAEQTVFIGAAGDKLILGCLNISRTNLLIFLKKLNIDTAGCLDGGGSSTLVVGNDVKYGGRRAVADALVVYYRKN